MSWAPSAPNCESALLQEYIHVLGLWQRDTKPYGGLLQIVFDNQAGADKIIGKELAAPKYPNLFEPIRATPVFRIEAGPPGSGQNIQHCLGSGSHAYEPPHPTEIKFVSQENGGVTHIHTKCTAPYHHHASLQGIIQEEIGMSQDDDYRMKMQQKFTALFGFMHEYNYTRLEWPMPAGGGAIIQPGLFKGDFGGDGVELIMLTYEANGTRINATKVTGDTCVPAGEIAFKVNLMEAVVLRQEQQSPIDGLRVVEVLCPPPNPLSALPMQPFIMPEGVTDCDFDTPNSCKARFYGLAQIAFEGFTDPVFTSGHWIVFNEDLMGFLYFDLESFTLFHRVTEKIA